MEIYLIVAIISIVVMGILGYLIGNRGKKTYIENINKLEINIAELSKKNVEQESMISEKGSIISTLTAERDVQRANAENYSNQLITQKEMFEKQQISQIENYETRLESQKSDFDNRIKSLKDDDEKKLQNELERSQKRLDEQKVSFLKQIDEQKATFEEQQKELKDTFAKQLSAYKAEMESQRNGYEKRILTLKDEAQNNLQNELARGQKLLDEQKASSQKQIDEQKTTYEDQIREQKTTFEEQQKELKDTFAKQLSEFKAESEKILKKQEETSIEMKRTYEQQIKDLKASFEKQLNQTKEAHEGQIAALKEMNDEQVKNQLDLIREQMQTTSEKVLKIRQEELGAQNKDQVSKIIDPLQKSLKDMQEALDKTKVQQNEALTRLDETIKINMQKSIAIGETADRLTRALTGEVKVQGNFGELKLKQLLEDLELKEGEQFDTQETLKNKSGKNARGDDGHGLIPDFILHFPNNRHVVVDSKMSLTDYERYMNEEDDSPKKRSYLKAHIDSVRAQVKRLAKKEYTKYLPDGYNRLNFAIMYVPIEGALNLALLNDASLWREAYDEGVMILGPQTMYMNLRVLEMMWTQVRQLKNQQAMMDAANSVIDRVQDFGIRFMDVESSMNETIKKISKLKITTADNGPSIITAARNLLKAGAKENKKKKSLSEMDDSMFLEADSSIMLPSEIPTDSIEIETE